MQVISRQPVALGPWLAGSALLASVAGFSTWLHPDMFRQPSWGPFVALLLVTYPTLITLGLLMAGARWAIRFRPLMNGVGIAGYFTGLPLLFMMAMANVSIEAIVTATVLQLVTIPLLLPRSADGLALLCRIVRRGVLILAALWLVASLAFSAWITHAAHRFTGTAQYCFTAPGRSHVFQTIPLPASQDIFLLQGMLSHAQDIYFGRHRLELTLFQGGLPTKTYHWSFRARDFIDGGHLTIPDACRSVLREAR